MAVSWGGNKEWVRGEGESEIWKVKERIGVGEGSRSTRRSSKGGAEERNCEGGMRKRANL